MKRMNIGPAFRYQAMGSLRATGLFIGIMLLLMALTTGLSYWFLTHGVNSSGSNSSFTFATMIFSFVMGICLVREALRLFIQNGVGRTTTFVTQLLFVAVFSIVLAVAAELYLLLGRLITMGLPNMIVTDLFQMGYFGGMTPAALEAMTLLDHLTCIACAFSLFAAAYLGGMFLSLLFFRLNKMWTIIVAVGVPVLFFIGLPVLLSVDPVRTALVGPVGKAMAETVIRLITYIVSGPWAFVSVFLILAAVLGAIDWLLIRRAPIKPSKG